MNFHIYAKGETKSGFEFEGILSAYYRISNDVVKRLGGIDKAIEELKKQVNVNQHLKNDALFSSMVNVSHEFVTSKKRKWIDGEYYAHEYGEYDAYCDGRGRQIKYSNGYVEYEIQCLDKSKSVLDGIWDKSDIGVSVIGNGCGDHFTPFSKLLFAKEKRK